MIQWTARLKQGKETFYFFDIHLSGTQLVHPIHSGHGVVLPGTDHVAHRLHCLLPRQELQYDVLGLVTAVTSA